MARQLRIQYPGTVYHVMSRGDRREPIFADAADRRRFQQWKELRRGWCLGDKALRAPPRAD